MLLALMMKRQYPKLRCLCYSPPGCLLTHRLATSCKDFVMTYVLDFDLVSRLGLETLDILRDEVLALIARIKVPKYKVLLAYLKRNTDDLPELIEKLMCKREHIPDNEFTRKLQQLKVSQERRRALRGEQAVQLYPPGRIVHLVRVSKGKTCLRCCCDCATCGNSSQGRVYVPKYAMNEDFKEILVANTMATDHFPNNIAHAVQYLADSFGVDPSVPPIPKSQ